MIYVFSQGSNLKPSGGVKVLFDIVQVLNTNQMEAKLLINGGNYAPQWFIDNNIPLESDISKVTENDVVVFHEETLWAFDVIKTSGCKHIILNQGAHWSLVNHLGYDRTKAIYDNALFVMVNSEYTGKLVRKLFGNHLKIRRFHIGIEPYFMPGNKQNQVCYMPRRNSETAECIVQYLEGKHHNWIFTAIEDVSHNDTANVMGSSKLFLSFGGPEGFGMPPVEAALAGCAVVGFDGFGGGEYFKPPVFTPVPFMDIVKFMDVADNKIKTLERVPQHWISHIHVNYLRKKYSKEVFQVEICNFFTNIS